MKHHRVLLISHTPLFAEAVTNLLQREEIDVVVPAGHRNKRPLESIDSTIDYVVVEMGSLGMSPEVELTGDNSPGVDSPGEDSPRGDSPGLDAESSNRNKKIAEWSINEHIQAIVFLAHDNNRMVIHRCETIENGTSEQLIQALQN